MTFSEYIIKERSRFFYFESLKDMVKSNTKLTLEEWFSDLYIDYEILYMNGCTSDNCRHIRVNKQLIELIKLVKEIEKEHTGKCNDMKIRDIVRYPIYTLKRMFNK